MIETKFRNTGSHIIPSDWEEGCLEHYTSKIGSGATPTGGEASYKEEGISLIRSLNVYNDGFKYDRLAHINKEQAAELDNVSIEEGDVLVNITGASVARCCVVPDNILPARVNQHVSIIRTNKDTLNYKFLWYLLTSPLFQKELIALSKGNGGTREALTKKQLQDFLITLPSSSDEQSCIAKALSDVDYLISTTKRLIEKKRNIKLGAMKELLHGHHRLPGFSDKWIETTLGSICEITMGQSPSSEFYNTKGDGLPLIQGNADMENRKSIVRFYSSSYTKFCDAGDIIMSVRAPVGSVGRAQHRSCLGRGVCALKYNNDFLFHYLISIENSWSSLSSGSIFDSINSKELAETTVLIPQSNEEQQAIALILSDMDSEISSLESRLIKYQSLKQGMMQQLLTGKIRLI